ncbi:hypothetical protein T05_7849 [Trichinella murrelli]|uniref:Uncharacterized protein n=1 Tax=Trichinella murrelli TaxID=144512 RepID=A0A0V0TPY6_9BILA|nr:hypothetical protein T05_7849 [Trichinella murrelli]
MDARRGEGGEEVFNDHNNIIHFRHCHDLETCNKRLACRKYNSTFESRLFLKDIKVMHHTNVSITGAIRRNLQRTTISCKHSIAHGEKSFNPLCTVGVEEMASEFGILLLLLHGYACHFLLNFSKIETYHQI